MTGVAPIPHIVVLGEALIDVFADTGTSLRDARELHPRPGGAPANVAYALAGLGADVGFVGKVGADDYGYWLIDILHDKGVDITDFEADSHAPTMLAIVAAPTPTVQQFILYSGASTLLRSDTLPRDSISTAQVFVFGGVTLSAGSRDAALQASRWAREADHHVVFDVNLRPSLWPDIEEARPWTIKGVATANVVKLNETELEFLTGSDDPALGSRRLIEQGIQLCCVSLGGDGAYFSTSAVSGHVPGMDVQALDTTGCGDAFVAGLALRISQLDKPISQLSETELDNIVRFANTCGGLAAVHLGAMVDLPFEADVAERAQSIDHNWSLWPSQNTIGAHRH